MSEKLLPCPFCGGEAERQIEYDRIAAGEMGIGSSAGSVSRTYVVCSKCGAKTQQPNQYSQFHWNRRASLPQPTAQSTREYMTDALKKE